MDPAVALEMTLRPIELSGVWWSEQVRQHYGDGPRRMMLDEVLDASDLMFEAQAEGVRNPSNVASRQLAMVLHPVNFHYWNRIESAMLGHMGPYSIALQEAAPLLGVVVQPEQRPITVGRPLFNLLWEEEVWYQDTSLALSQRQATAMNAGLGPCLYPNFTFSINFLPDYVKARGAVMGGYKPEEETRRFIAAITRSDLAWFRELYAEAADMGIESPPSVWAWLDALEKDINEILL